MSGIFTTVSDASVKVHKVKGRPNFISGTYSPPIIKEGNEKPVTFCFRFFNAMSLVDKGRAVNDYLITIACPSVGMLTPAPSFSSSFVGYLFSVINSPITKNYC